MHTARSASSAIYLGLILACPIALAACSLDGASKAGVHTTKVIQPPGSAKVIQLTGRPQHLLLPAHKRYGIYVNDANNSGYSLRCSAKDARGRRIRMNDRPPATVSSSGTNHLDLVYDTGSGHITITCSAPGEQTTTRLLNDVIR